MNSLLASSSNPDKASMTLQGGLVLLVSFLVGVASSAGADLSAIPTGEVDIAQQVQNITFGVGSIMTGLGSLRKVWNWVRPLFSKWV